MSESERVGLAHEIWALAQLGPSEGIEDGAMRIAAALSDCESTETRIAELQAEKAGLESVVVAQAAAISELRAAPVTAQQLVVMGLGRYVVNHSDVGEPPQLIISAATDQDRAGREVGESRDNAPGKTIDPKDMAVRIFFDNAKGIDAIETQLQLLREAHFKESIAAPPPASAQPAEPVKQVRPETPSEHIARDMREGRFPDRSEAQTIPANPTIKESLTVAEPVKVPSDELQSLSDRAYCQYVEQMRRPECLGWEQKVKDNRIGEDELKAHTKAGEFLGRHRAFSEAGALLSRHGAAQPAASAEQVGDAIELLSKYRKLCKEVRRGDGFHLQRINNAIVALSASPVAAQPSVPDVSDDDLIRIFWKHFRNFPSSASAVTHTKWKDGIDIDVLSAPMLTYSRELVSMRAPTPPADGEQQ